VSKEFVGALLQLNAEKGVSREQLVRTVEDAIQSAYRRVAPGFEDVHVRLDVDSGHLRVFRARPVVAEVEDPETEFSLEQAHEHSPNARIGDLVEYEELDASQFGRVGAQSAGQVVRQRLREAERETLFDEFAHREGEIITGSVSRVEPTGIILDLGKAEAILRTTDQSSSEHYRIGQHVKAYVLEVRRTTRGPLIYVSRTHKSFLRRLFELEVPEIGSGTVEIKAIAREAGSRSKVAVASRQEGLDPVGATVGQRGGRVQAVVAELGGEKIDVIPWSEEPDVFVANALSPAQVVGVAIDEEHRIASVTVPERMLSLAIGREGQNARLAAKLTGWRIDIRSDQAHAVSEPLAAEPAVGAVDEPFASESPVGVVADDPGAASSVTPDTAAEDPVAVPEALAEAEPEPTGPEAEPTGTDAVTPAASRRKAATEVSS
jgi:transcription termination/antitermination protein NusA